VPEALLLLAYDAKFSFGTLVGYGFGSVCDPDWDLVTANNAESRLLKIPILGHFLFGISSFYGSYFFHKHRGFWSHFPVVSTIIRILFVFTIPFILLDYWGINLIGDGGYMFYLGFWSGLSQADGIHWFLDKFYNPTGE